MKQFLKRCLSLCHISVTRNQKYDAYTRKIIEKSLKSGSNCIDIGCHKGEILDLMIKGAPQGVKYGFEPIPELYSFLKEKYQGNPSVVIHDTALYDTVGTTSFQHVVNAPAYSGIKRRRYDGKSVEINQITVKTGLLDQFITPDIQIDLIKIDVEGAEYKVMLGAVETIRRCKPVIIFEFGLGAADFYNSQPENVYRFLVSECGLRVSTLKGFIDKAVSLQEKEFTAMYMAGSEYYFVAHP